MTDFAAACYYARHDGTEDTTPERDLTTVRGAAAWGLEQARVDRSFVEFSSVRLDLAQTTFRRAALDCAGICAGMLAGDSGRGTYALKWARAYWLLWDRADRARVSRAGGAT